MSAKLFERYKDLQKYVGWGDDDAARIASVAGVVGQHIDVPINDFYQEIKRHPDAVARYHRRRCADFASDGQPEDVAVRKHARPKRCGVRYASLEYRAAVSRDRTESGVHGGRHVALTKRYCQHSCR